MSDSMHDLIGAFYDGELPAAEADAFRAHLGECDRCQAELREMMLLSAAAQPLATAQSRPAAAPVIALATRRRRTIIAAVSVLAVAAGLVLAWKLTQPKPIMLALASARPIESRLSVPSADRWRPYDVARANATASEEIPVDTMAALERRHDLHGLADAYLLSGEAARAGELLARQPASADVESDAAAVALQTGDAAAALTHATRALAMSPGHRQAAWNRALALRDLGLPRAAAAAFDEVARRQEPGWSSEAMARAKSLREVEASRDALRAAAERAVASGDTSDPSLTRALPALFAHARAVAAHDAAHDPWRLLDDEWRATRVQLTGGDAAAAEKRAIDGFSRALAAGIAPGELPRRFLLLAADAARAGRRDVVADAYVDEARRLATP